MTQHGSFPGRPRGRRARPDNDVPEWAGYDAEPQDEREFPDLSPIRGQQARARHGRVQDGRETDGYAPNSPGYAPTGPGDVPVGPGQAGPGPGGPGSVGRGPAGPGQAGPGQAPWQEQPWPSSQAPHAPQAAAQPPAPQPPQGQHSPHGAPDWADPVDPDDPMEAFSERWHRRGGDSREESRADRRKRRRVLIVGGGAAAVAIAVAVYFLTGGSGGPANLSLGSLVTTFLPGELQQVPNACTSVPSATLAQYLPGQLGQLKKAAPPLNSGANTQCTWTLDKAPLYRVLEVNMQAYSPSGLASGDGSATFAAEDAYSEDETAKQNPGPHSGQPKATVTDLPGMPGGNDTSAFEATQVFNVNGAITDVATVVVRYRNVIVTVVMNGLDHANKGNYGPVSPGVLSSAAQTVARQVTGGLVH